MDLSQFANFDTYGGHSMEIYSGLRLINAHFENGRQINLWLFEGQRRLLVDSGVAGVPTETILPYLANLGLSAADLDLLVNLHAHADHIGGNAELFAVSVERLRIGAHALDAPGVANHRRLATEVYGLTDEERIQTLIHRCGADAPVSERYQDGDQIELGDFSLEVVHAPGHTAGNISLYDRAHGALLHGESVMGAPMVTDQGLRSTPFGADPNAYRRALTKLAALDFACFLSSHQPPKDSAAGRELIGESLSALDEYEQFCAVALRQGVASIEELAEAVAREGRYQIGPRLLQQVGATLRAWLDAGRAISKAGGFALRA